MPPIRSICVYCGSQPGRDSAYGESGRLLGKTMAQAGIGLVYGGGAKGIMGAVADGVLAAGGRVTGIIPRFLVAKESSARSLDRLTEVVMTEDMHQRKHAMFERSDAFVAMPGGIGTLEEVVEIMTWAQLGRHAKPIVFANINGFWEPMLTLISHMREEGFVHTASRVTPIVVNEAEAIVATLQAVAERDGKGDAEIIRRL